MNEAANEALHTLFNELCNNDWKFDGQPVEELNIDEDRRHIHIHLPDHRMVTIEITESTSPTNRICGNCGQVKPGWPDDWRNIAGKHLVYACADCVAEHEKEKPNG